MNGKIIHIDTEREKIKSAKATKFEDLQRKGQELREAVEIACAINLKSEARRLWMRKFKDAEEEVQYCESLRERGIDTGEAYHASEEYKNRASAVEAYRKFQETEEVVLVD